MDEDELTRKAVEEIMHEMQLYKEREERPQQERKKNPLAKTNKHFLGRTLNAMVRHNERTNNQTRKRSNKKLKELDERKNKHISKRKSNSYERKRYHERKKDFKDHFETSACESKSKHKKKRKKSKTKKKKKRHNRSRSSSCSSISTPDEKYKSEILDNQNIYNDYEDVEQTAPYLTAPTLWDIQLQQFYQYKALMALGAAAAQTANTNTVQIVELHSSSSSLSDIKFDESLSSSEENNGEMLTISVTDSDDDKDVSKEVPTITSKALEDINSSIEIVDSDCTSVKSIFSAESADNAIDLTED